jgi:tetratricopeptide (TPR) repeat protein
MKQYKKMSVRIKKLKQSYTKILTGYHFFEVLIILSVYLFSPVNLNAQFQKTIQNNKNLYDIENYLIFNIDSAYIIASNINQNSDSINIEFNKYLTTTFALIHQLKGNSKEAVILLEKAKSIDIEDKYLVAYTLYVDALISMEIGDITLSLEAIFNAIELFIELKQDEKLASCYTVLSKLYYSLGNINDAERSLIKSIKMHTDNCNTPRLAGDYHNLAILMSGRNSDTSLVLLQKAIMINKNYRNYLWLANNYGLKSNILAAKGIIDSSKYYIQKAEFIYMQQNNSSYMLDARSQRGRLFFMEKNLDSAASLFNSVINESQAPGVQVDLTDAYFNLSEIYFQKQNYLKSREYNQKYIFIKDSLQKNKNDKMISIVEIRDRYANQKEALKLENEKITLASYKKNWIIVAMVFLIFVVLFYIYTILKWKRFNEKKDKIDRELLQKEIELQNKELTLAILSKVKQSKSIDLLEEKLKNIENSAPKKIKSEVNKLVNEISHEKGPLLWKEFEMRFTKINDDFYTKLKNSAPNLSPAEIKICSFLKMGLNTKEIAAILYKSINTIEVDRARIRKKLGLVNVKTNLYTFLNEL